MELTEKKKIKEYREEILKILNNTIEKIELEQYYSVEKNRENIENASKMLASRLDFYDKNIKDKELSKTECGS